MMIKPDRPPLGGPLSAGCQLDLYQGARRANRTGQTDRVAHKIPLVLAFARVEMPPMNWRIFAVATAAQRGATKQKKNLTSGAPSTSIRRSRDYGRFIFFASSMLPFV
jgi:hypothetical protein